MLKKKNSKSPFRRINDWLHLWLGLSSGLVIFIVGITGCIYVFEREIRNITQPYQFVKPHDKAFLPPSALREKARAFAFDQLPDTGENRIRSLQYGDAGRAAIAAYQTRGMGYVMIYLDPYSGQVLRAKVLERDFFRIVLDGHFYLWLPKNIGKTIVASSVLIFVVLLVSGLVMWWPKSLKKSTVDRSFKIKWKANFKRLNYDLHNVLGFYVMLAGLVLALTGLVWGFEWYKKSLYWVTSGGRSLPGKEVHRSDTTFVAAATANEASDRLWLQLRPASRNEQGSLQIQFPLKSDDVISVVTNPEHGTYYRREFSRYDRYSLRELPQTGVFAKTFSKAAGADQLNRMNYDIHVGAILGLPGKILAFFASLICGSLPITGFIFWLGRKKGKRHNRNPRQYKASSGLVQKAALPDARPVGATSPAAGYPRINAVALRGSADGARTSVPAMWSNRGLPQ